MKLSNRAKNIAQSEIRAMSILCNEKNGLNMAQGLCDLEVPLPVVQGAKEGMDIGKNTYTSAYGNYKLRAAIAKKQNDFYDQGIEVDNVLVSLGATGAFYATAMSLLNEGDEVIVFGEQNPIEEIANKIGTIPYEVLTGISSRVKRVYVNE